MHELFDLNTPSISKEKKLRKIMEIEVKRVTPWSRVLDAARWTVGKESNGKEPSSEWKTRMMFAQHSPIRLLEYDIKIKGIPYCNAVHFIRHHIGIEKFQCSLRDDRNEEIDDRKKLPQDYPVNLWVNCNAEALINISQKRLCMLAEYNTRMIWTKVLLKIREIDPEVEAACVRTCIYRGFCPEMKTCGYASKYEYAITLGDYRNKLSKARKWKMLKQQKNGETK